MADRAGLDIDVLLQVLAHRAGAGLLKAAGQLGDDRLIGPGKVEQPLAAAIGARVPIQEPSGFMIVDLGGGTTEVAVISLGGVVTFNSLTVAGNELDENIIQYARENFNLLLGPKTAEEIEAIVQRHPLVKYHGLSPDSMDLIRAHQMVEAGHRHDAYAMVVNYATTRTQQQAVLTCLKKCLTLWLAYRDAIAKSCGMKKTPR